LLGHAIHRFGHRVHFHGIRDAQPMIEIAGRKALGASLNFLQRAAHPTGNKKRDHAMNQDPDQNRDREPVADNFQRACQRGQRKGRAHDANATRVVHQRDRQVNAVFLLGGTVPDRPADLPAERVANLRTLLVVVHVERGSLRIANDLARKRHDGNSHVGGAAKFFATRVNLRDLVLRQQIAKLLSAQMGACFQIVLELIDVELAYDA
jgi:hypothetical protein